MCITSVSLCIVSFIFPIPVKSVLTFKISPPVLYSLVTTILVVMVPSVNEMIIAYVMYPLLNRNCPSYISTNPTPSRSSC